MTMGLTLGRIGVTRMKRGGGVLAITGTPPIAVQNAAYNFTPNATGGSGTKSFALTGSLPTGLSFSTVTGAITGTPTVVATTSGLNITVTDTSGSQALGAFSLQVVAPLAITGTPGAATQNVAYTFTPGTSGGSGAKSFALTGTLPTGLSFSTSTGAITGTPTVIQTATGLNITVTDSTGSSSLGTFSIAVSNAATMVLANATGVNCSQFATVTGSPALSFAGTVGGYGNQVRTTTTTTGNKVWEGRTGSSFNGMHFGIDFSGASLQTTATYRPGIDDSTGVSFEIDPTFIRKGIGGNSFGGDATYTWQANDAFQMEINTTTGAGTLWLIRSGGRTSMHTFTVNTGACSPLMGVKGTGITCTANFGQSAFLATPTSGYTAP